MAFCPVRLNHAVLFVSDLERAVRFYRETFGMDGSEGWADEVRLSRVRHGCTSGAMKIPPGEELDVGCLARPANH